MKFCNECKCSLPLECFRLRKRRGKAVRYTYCRPCELAKKREARARKNPKPAPHIPVIGKICFKCGQDKPLSEYSPNKAKKGGLNHSCISCMAEYRERNRERFNEAARVWREDNKAKLDEQRHARQERARQERERTQRTWREANPELAMKLDEEVKRHTEEAEQRRIQNRKQYYLANKEKHNARSKAYRAKNRERMKEVDRLYRESHKEEAAEYKKAWAERNKDKLSRRYRDYYFANKERKRDYHKQWRSLNREIVRHIARHRVARHLRAEGTYTLEQFLAKCEYHGWRCYLCGAPVRSGRIHAEHRKPLSRGGSNWVANIAPSCPSCNCAKRDKTEAEFRRHRKEVLGFHELKMS